MKNILESSKFNVIPSPEDERDYRVKGLNISGENLIFEDFVVNTKEDNKAYNQGNSSQCAGFGCAGYQSQLDVGRGLPYQRYSPVSLYGNRFDESEYQGEGQFLRNIVKDWARSGVAKWEDAPFVGTVQESIEYFKNLTEEIREDMLNHRINTFYRVDSYNIEEMYNIMVKFNIPILIGYSIYQSMAEGFHNGGIIRVPNEDEKDLGGHCSYVCGYKNINGKGYWMVVNSWGDHIFDSGIMYVPVEFNIWEAWVMFPKVQKTIVFKIDSDTYTVNGDEFKMDTIPTVVNDRTYLPIRYLMENLDALKVEWSEKTETARIYIGGDVLLFKVGDNGFTSSTYMKKILFEEDVDRQPLTRIFLDKNSRMQIPIRSVFEFLGLSVEWIGETKEIIVKNF